MQGHRMSVAWPSPEDASSDSISAGTRAIGYCQPNFKKRDENGKISHSSC